MSGSEEKEEADQPGLDDLIPLSKAADMSGLSQGHLTFLIRKKKLWGTKIGRNWVTTKRQSENIWPVTAGQGDGYTGTHAWKPAGRV